MKLLVLEPDPSYGGGSEAVVLSLGRELARRGHSIYLLHESEGSMLPEYRAFAAMTLRRRLPGFALRSPLRTLACVIRIAWLARRLGIDAIVSSHLGFIRHCALVRLLTGVRSCFHLGLPLAGATASMRLANARVGDGVAPSAHTADTWKSGGWPSESLHVVRNWVDPQRFMPVPDVGALRRELGLPVSGGTVVFVGRICAQKGVGVLLPAFARLADTIEDAHLVVVGAVAPDYQATWEAALDALDGPVRRRVVLKPVTATPEKYYAAADVACAPSLTDEAFGLTVLEAMACGVPVVASDVGIISQIVGSEGSQLLSPPGDVVALAERLGFWLARPDGGAACGRRLRDRVLRHFGPEASIDAYERVIGHRGAGRDGVRERADAAPDSPPVRNEENRE